MRRTLFGTRMKAARLRISKLQYLEMENSGMSPRLGLRFYKIFVRPLAELAAHFAPLTTRDLKAMNDLEADAIGRFVKGFRRGTMQRLRAIVGLPPFYNRREHLKLNMKVRLANRTEEEGGKAVWKSVMPSRMI